MSITLPADVCQVHILLADTRPPVSLFALQWAQPGQQNVAATSSLIQALLQFSREVDDGTVDLVVFKQPEAAMTEGLSAITQLNPLLRHRSSREKDSPLNGLSYALISVRIHGILAAFVVHYDKASSAQGASFRQLLTTIAEKFEKRYETAIAATRAEIQAGANTEKVEAFRGPYTSFSDTFTQ